jgi:uncharacterized protein (DUF2141 family)
MFRPMLLSAAILAGFATQTHAADLTIRVDGVAPTSGQILLSLFDSSEDWMNAPAASRTLAINASGSATTSFEAADGTYAIALIHDANANGKMDTNALGLPKEAFGFSNGARARFGPPSFDRTSFVLPRAGMTLTIRLDCAE